MAYILHIDTSGDIGLTALAKDGEVLGIIENADTRNHAAVLNLNIEAMLEQHNLKLKDLDAIAVCGGPGSYTGLRIGLATAKGFCYALDKPLMMHNKLLLLAAKYAYNNNGIEYFVSMLQARDKEYFAAVYDKELKTVKEPQHLTDDDLSDFATSFPTSFIITGFQNEAIKDAFSDMSNLNSNSINVDIYSWAKYAFAQNKNEDYVTLSSCEPFYLKQVYTHKPKNTNNL